MESLSLLEAHELVRLLALNHKAAFEELYRRYWPSLYDAAYKRLKDPDQCKDIVQDLFTDLWIRRGEVEIENPEAYLHTAIRFQVYKAFARGKGNTSFFELFETIATSPFSADNNLADKELSELARAWLESLPEKRKEIFVLHYVENLSTKDISDRLNISQKTVQNQLGFATKSLHKKLVSFLVLGLTA